MSRTKLYLPIVVLALSVLTGLICGQEPPLPASGETPYPTASPVATRPQLNIPDIPLPVEPPALVPNALESLPGAKSMSPGEMKQRPTLPLSQLDAAFQKSPLAQAAEEQRLHLEWRQLQNRVAQDADVLATRRAAARAKTDLEKRERLRAYYNLAYGRMQALATTPQLKAYLEGKKAAALGGLAQPRVRPGATPGKR